MRKVFIVLSVFILTVSLKAEIIRKDQVNADNLKKMAGSVYAYEAPTEPLTPAPKGFKPVYLTHFGRHGSRFLDNASNYDRPYNILKEADDAGALTDFGKDVLRRVEIIRAEADQRAGDLTQKGMQQHRDIARRMVENYPALFTNDKIIMARSTTSHRVLVSEYSALMQILRMRPKIKFDYDSSNHDEPWMYTEDKGVSAHKRKASAAVSEFNQRHTHPERLMKALFKDPEYIKTNGGRDQSNSLYTSLYDLASYVQGSDPGATLQNFIDFADEALAGNGVSVMLRYGHEVTLMSYFCLLDLNGSGYSTDDLETVADHWAAYNLAYMGGNVQWVFFRDKKGNVIVKFLLNEQEATLPESVPFYKDAKGKEQRPYYRWEDVKKFYLDKIAYWEDFKAHDETPVEETPRRSYRQEISTSSN